MGTRYHVSVTCPSCGHQDSDVYYAPTSGFLFWTCQCGQEFDLETLTGINAESTANTEHGVEAIRRQRSQP